MASGSLSQVGAEEDAQQPDPLRQMPPQVAAAMLLPKADPRQQLQAPDVQVEAEDRR